MSASDKLRALEERINSHQDFSIAELCLPQIRALVEAAELKPSHVYVGIPMADGRPSGRVRYPLIEALDALDKALP